MEDVDSTWPPSAEEPPMPEREALIEAGLMAQLVDADLVAMEEGRGECGIAPHQLGAAWRIGETLYTLVTDERTDRTAVFALRASGQLEKVTPYSGNILPVWYELTACYAPVEPLSQLRHEQWVRDGMSQCLSALGWLDQTESEHYTEDLNALLWAQTHDIRVGSEAVDYSKRPPTHMLWPSLITQMKSKEAAWLAKCAAQLGHRDAGRQLEAAVTARITPADPALLAEAEEIWALPSWPRTPNAPESPHEENELAAMGRRIVGTGRVTPWEIRPHGHRERASLLAQRRLADELRNQAWAYQWQAESRAAEVQRDAARGTGHRMRSLQRARDAVYRAAHLRQQAAWHQARADECGTDADSFRRQLRQSRKTRGWLTSRPSPGRQHRMRRIIGEQWLASYHELAAKRYFVEARNISPVVDPERKLAELERHWQQLTEEAGAADMRDAPRRAAALRSNAMEWRRRAHWHHCWSWSITEELAMRACLGSTRARAEQVARQQAAARSDGERLLPAHIQPRWSALAPSVDDDLDQA